MGLIRVATDATLSTMTDTWKYYFACDALDNDTLVLKGIKKGSKSFFKKSVEDNYITDGSGIVVADGQCMLIVDDGVVSEVCIEPGLYTFDSHSATSFFDNSFKEGLNDTFDEIVSRFGSAGISRKDSRIYYFNTKEILGNKFATSTPIPFRIIDKNIGLDVDISIRCNGEYSFKIINPLLFYKNVCGDDVDNYNKETLIIQMKTEFLNALQLSLAKIVMDDVRYSEVPLHIRELCDVLHEKLSSKWVANRGIKIISLAINSLTLANEGEDMVKNLQKNKVFTDTNMAAVNLASAQTDVVRDAAKNTNGAMVGFTGVGMTNILDGNNDANLFIANKNNQASGLFCPKCCASVSSGDMFCAKCGNKLK